MKLQKEYPNGDLEGYYREVIRKGRAAQNVSEVGVGDNLVSNQVGLELCWYPRPPTWVPTLKGVVPYRARRGRERLLTVSMASVGKPESYMIQSIRS
eukprot:624551-Pelagomonas_calceolata.AAC.1